MYGNGYYGTEYYGGGTTDTESLGLILGMLGTYSLVIAIISIFTLVCMWKIFKKAGKKGWESLIPIYNFIVMLQIAELPMWYIILFLIPIANIFVTFKLYIELAHKFGKSTGFGIASIFVPIICLPILAFGKATYMGTSNMNNNSQNTNNTQNQFNTNNSANQNYNNNMNTIQNNNQNYNNQSMNSNMNYQPVEPAVQQNIQPQNIQPQNIESQFMNNEPTSPVMATANTMNINQQNTMQSTPQTSFFDSPAPVQNIEQFPKDLNANTANQEPTTKTCTNCGSQVNINANNCPMCGHQF